MTKLKTGRVRRTTIILIVWAAMAGESHAQIFTVLYNFDITHGANPQYPALLAQGRDGNLYGTTTEGGSSYAGVVFKITPQGNLTVLYNFDGTAGAYPYGGLTLGTDGNFYGTTLEGGGNGCSGVGCGTVFKVTPSGDLTVLHTFTGGTDGGSPNAPPVEGTDGAFYGTTLFGPTYKIAGTRFSSLAKILGGSYAPLMLASNGNFYGSQTEGENESAVVEMTPNGSLTTVYDLAQDQPYAPVMQGRDGDLYGTTIFGGSYGQGIAFKLSPQGFSVLHNFPDPNYPGDGAESTSGLVEATDGKFYGNAGAGGTYRLGVCFRLTNSGGYALLHEFSGPDGAGPSSTMVQHTNGNIYGLTDLGGTGNMGVLYSLNLALQPFVKLVVGTGRIGQTADILGQGFTGTTNVSFNGISANFTVVSDTYLTAAVPPGATTGYVTVTTPTGVLTSNVPFHVIP